MSSSLRACAHGAWGIPTLTVVGLTAAALCFVLSGTAAEAASGQALLSGKQRLKIKKCGKAGGETSADLSLRDDGGWTLTFDGGVIDGTYVGGGKGNRRLAMTPDAASTAALAAYFAGEVSSLCEGAGGTVSSAAKRILAKVNKKETKVVFKMIYLVEGDRRGKYRLRGSGPLAPLPTTTLPPTTSTTVANTTTTMQGSTTTTLAGSTTTTLANTTTTLPGSTTTTVPPTTTTIPAEFCATQPAGTPCTDDGNACTIDECDGNTCQHTPVDCSDVYSCTQDSCNPATGCLNQGLSALCNDGSICTIDFCAAGAPGSDPQSGCLYVPTNTGAICGTESERCDAEGSCVAGCTIASMPYADGDLNPSNPCQMCDPSRSETEWSPALLGTVCRPLTGECDVVEVCNGVSEECPIDIKRTTPKYRTIPVYESFDHCAEVTGGVGWCDGVSGVCQTLGNQPCDKDCYVQGQWELDFDSSLICRGYPAFLLPEGTYCGQALVNACVTKTCSYRLNEFNETEAVCSPVLNSFPLPEGTVCEQEEFGVPGEIPYTPECKDECKCGLPAGSAQIQCIPTTSDAQLGDPCSQDADCAFDQRCVDGQCATATTRAIGEACTGGDTDNPCSSGEFCCANKNHAPVGQAGTCWNGCCADSECEAGRSCCAADGCVDLETDVLNCGVCGNDCSALIEQSACFSDQTAACIGGQCVIADAVPTCAAGHLCGTVTNIALLKSGDVIRQEGTTNDFTVITRTTTEVIAEDAGGNIVSLPNVEFNYAICAPPAEGVLPELKLDPNLCAECELVEPENDCSAGNVCQTKCDGSFWEILFCGGFSGAFGVCVPEGTVTACE